MLAHDELYTCEASLIPPEQFVLGTSVSPIDMTVNMSNVLINV